MITKDKILPLKVIPCAAVALHSIPNSYSPRDIEMEENNRVSMISKVFELLYQFNSIESRRLKYRGEREEI